MHCVDRFWLKNLNEMEGVIYDNIKKLFQVQE